MKKLLAYLLAAAVPLLAVDPPVRAPTPSSVIDGSADYCLDSGSANALSCSLTPAPAAYVTGAVYRIKAANTNTGASTANFNSLGSKTIKKVVADGVTTDVIAGDIVSGKVLDLRYDGTNLQLISGGGIITLWFDAAACSGTTGALNWDTLSTGAPTATCSAGSTNSSLIRGVADFADTGTYQMMRQFPLPAAWVGTMDLKIRWRSTATSGNAVWQASTVCIADAEVDDAAWNTASTVTDAAKGTSNQLNEATISSVTITGCSAGEMMHLRLLRDPANASDTLGATASVIGVEVTLRRAQ